MRPLGWLFRSTSRYEYRGSSAWTASSIQRDTTACSASSPEPGSGTNGGTDNRSAPHERRQLHEAHLRAGADHERLVERFRLTIVDEDEEAVPAERVERARELGLPVDVAILRDLEAVQRALGVGRLHEAAEQAAGALAAEVVVADFLVDALADQLADRDAFTRELERKLVNGVTGCGLVSDHQGRGHGYLGGCVVILRSIRWHSETSRRTVIGCARCAT